MRKKQVKIYEHLFSFHQGISAAEVADDSNTTRHNEHIRSRRSYL